MHGSFAVASDPSAEYHRSSAFPAKENRKGCGPALQCSSLQQRFYGLSPAGGPSGHHRHFLRLRLCHRVHALLLDLWPDADVRRAGKGIGQDPFAQSRRHQCSGGHGSVLRQHIPARGNSRPCDLPVSAEYASAHGHCRLPAFPGQSSLGSPGSGHLVGHFPAAYCHAPNVPGPVSVASRRPRCFRGGAVCGSSPLRCPAEHFCYPLRGGQVLGLQPGGP